MKKLFCKINIEWIIVFILMSFMAVDAYSYLSSSFGKYIPNFYDFIIYQTNSPRIICFLFTVIVFLLMIRVISMQNYNKLIRGTIVISILMKNILIRFFILFALFLVVNIIVYFISYGFYWTGFRNSWLYINELTMAGISPLLSMVLSFSFLFLRMFTLTIVALTASIYTKKEIGFIVFILLSLLDWGIYSLLNIFNPLGILPIEHTRIIYTDALLSSDQNYTRISFYVSVLYWTILISIFLAAILLKIKRDKKDVLCNEN